VIPTCQRSDIDLVRFGEVIEQEKDRLLERVCSACHLHATLAPCLTVEPPHRTLKAVFLVPAPLHEVATYD
jgi:hypothetical protein